MGTVRRKTRGPRVAGFVRDRRPDAVAALAAGPVVVERPACDWTADPRIEAKYEEHAREAFPPVDAEPLAVRWLGSVMSDQERLFKWRAVSHSGERPGPVPASVA
ncbi:hypothetical protein [Streptomyces sp. NK08204]|uniref:hypothetical protein n=1 Tax=Streptomyces sp. NK08204 TaxID=2873260 RepID=UPI001CEC3470|nr:hypothetical protein [Streptomyces sp. NK08204]